MESIQPGLQMMLDRGELLKSLRAFKRGDFSVRMPLNLTGIDGEIAQTFNDVVELEEAKATEIARVADQVGKEGQTASRMNVPGASQRSNPSVPPAGKKQRYSWPVLARQ